MAVVVKRLTQPAVNRSFEGSIPFDRPNIEFIGLIPKEMMASSLFCLKPIFAFFFVSLGSNYQIWMWTSSAWVGICIFAYPYSVYGECKKIGKIKPPFWFSWLCNKHLSIDVNTKVSGEGSRSKFIIHCVNKTHWNWIRIIKNPAHIIRAVNKNQSISINDNYLLYFQIICFRLK